MKALWHTESFMKELDGFQVSSLLLGNNRQGMLLCAKTISSLVRIVLSIAKAYMSLGIPSGAAATAG